MSLEKIVRPFQNGDVFTARALIPVQVPVPADAPDAALITWKGEQESVYSEAPPPYVQGFTAEWIEDKTQRITENVRVTNPDDDSQFVELERIKKMVIKNNVNGDEIPIVMDWKK